MAKATKKNTPATKRRFKEQQTIMHDLYKLEVAKVRKNMAWEPGVERIEDVEHVHFFHSVDKNGSPQTNCVPIAKHFHVMERVEGTELDYKCSGPKIWTMKRMPNGQTKREIVDLSTSDHHTHEVTYLDSKEFKQAKMNSEAVKFMSQSDKAPETVAGILG